MYKYFAEFYDKIMNDVDYNEWSDYIMDLIAHSGRSASSLLELGCGTGNLLFTLENENDWEKIIGIDSSYEMLSEAIKKRDEFNSCAEFIRADMKNFAFSCKFDLVLCIFDTVNYLLEEKALRRMLLNSYFALKNNKLLVFDMITIKKMNDFFNAGSFAQNMDDFSFIWECETVTFGKDYRIKASFFKKKENGYFEKIVEEHMKRIYSIDEMKKILSEMDFKLLGCFDAYSFRTADTNSERVFFLCSKGGI